MEKTGVRPVLHNNRVSYQGIPLGVIAQDLTLQAALSEGVATVRQTLSRGF